jgi:hypothetical protein
MYIDDGLFIIRGKTKDQAISLIHSLIRWPLNPITCEPSSIKIFTAQELTTTYTTFLDANISCQPSTQHGHNLYTIMSSLHTKSLATYHYLHWRSTHPRAMKRAVIKGELNRRVRICSTARHYHTACQDLKTKLLARHYPPLELGNLFFKYPFSLHRPLLNRTVARICRHRSTTNNPYKPSHPPKPHKQNITPVVVRYDPRIPIFGKISKHNSISSHPLHNGSWLHAKTTLARNSCPFLGPLPNLPEVWSYGP